MIARALVFVVAGGAVACGPGGRQTGDDGPPPECTGPAQRCDGASLQACVDGHWVDTTTCPRFCDDELGCMDCNPSLDTLCVGDQVMACNDDGTIGALVEDCSPDV